MRGSISEMYIQQSEKGDMMGEHSKGYDRMWVSLPNHFVAYFPHMDFCRERLIHMTRWVHSVAFPVQRAVTHVTTTDPVCSR